MQLFHGINFSNWRTKTDLILEFQSDDPSKVGKANYGNDNWNNKYNLPDFVVLIKFLFLFFEVVIVKNKTKIC
jgi:hypothetical protein